RLAACARAGWHRPGWMRWRSGCGSIVQSGNGRWIGWGKCSRTKSRQGVEIMARTTAVSRRRVVTSEVSGAVVAALPIRSTASNQIQNQKGDDMTTLTPYLLFNGTCREAMEFYQSCFGGELTLTKVKDSPAKDHMPAIQQEKVLNARLKKGNLE